jgi:hypothetical protein
MIGELSDDVLLKIFCYYLDTSPQCWPMLVHICRRWRHIIFASQRVLHLRLFCTYRTPVLKSLDCWPALPIVVEYGGALELDPLASEDEANIMVALKRSDRVHSIRLNLTNPLLEKLSAIKTTFSQLEDLVLQARDNLPLPLPVPDSLSWGRRIRSLELTRVTFSALPQLLYSSRELVHLHLHEVLYPLHSSPKVLADALHWKLQLRSLSLHLPPITNPIAASSLPRRRAFLDALTRVNFIGIAEYLEDFVAILDAPHLEDIEIVLFNESIPRLSNLIEFLDRITMHKSHRRAEILFSQNTLSISLTQPGAPTRFKLQLLCKALDTQLMTMIHILSQLRYYSFLLNVKDLRIAVTQESSQDDLWTMELSRQGCLHRSAAVPSLSEYLHSDVVLQSIQEDSCWSELIDSFWGAEQLHLAGNYSTKIVGALVRQRRWRRCLHKLYIRQPGPQHAAPLRSAVVTLMTSRRLSGHPIEVEYECHISEGLGEGTKHTHPPTRC